MAPARLPGARLATRVQNPNWWLIGGGVTAAGILGLGALARCRPRTVTIDQLTLPSLEGGQSASVYRMIRYKGCLKSLPYEVIVSTVDPRDFEFPGDEYQDLEPYVLFRKSYRSLKDAQQVVEDTDKEGAAGNPSSRKARIRARRRGRQTRHPNPTVSMVMNPRKGNPCCT